MLGQMEGLIMKEFIVQFVVQARDVKDALGQGEQYLNTGSRCVDLNVIELTEETVFAPLTKPATAKRLGEDPKVSCPWCSGEIAPVNTDMNVAVFHYTDPKDTRAAIRNPAMCPSCHGVGGWEDFGVE